jgi:hypothetical protein
MFANYGAPLSAKKHKPEAPAPRPPVTKPAFSVPHPYKTGFGFFPRGAQRTPEERERLRKERLAFFRRVRAYHRKNLPKIKLRRAPTVASNAPYIREYVCERNGCHRVIPSPALLAPPATNLSGEIIHPETFTVVPEIHEHAPPVWDEWCPTRRPEHDPEVDLSMLFVPPTCSTGGLYSEDVARFFPILWRKALAEHTVEVRVKKMKKTSSKARTSPRHSL